MAMRQWHRGGLTLVILMGLLAGACGNRRPDSEALELRLAHGKVQPEGPAGQAAGDAVAPAGEADGSSLPTAAPGVDPAAPGAPAPSASPAAPGGGTAGTGAKTRPSSPARTAAPSSGGQAGGASAPAAGPGAGASTPAPKPGPGSGAATGPAVYDQGASDSEIRLASVSALTGLVPDFMQPRGARAYFKYMNALGGVNGRKLNLLIYDDQWDVSRNAALTRQAYESDKVFAFVANYSPLANHGGRAFIEQNNVPVVGGDMINLKTWGVSPNYYPQSYLESVAGGQLAGRLAAELGCKAVAGMALSADESRSWVKAFRTGLTQGGVNGFVYEADISLAETDYTPYASAAKAKKADCITLGGETTSFIRLRKAMSQQNYQARLVLPSSAYDPRYAQDDATPDGDHIMVQYDILENQDANPAVKEFIVQASRFEPGMRQNGYSLLAWTAAKLATEAIRRMGNTITRQNLFDTLNGMKDFDTGITPRITFSPGPHPGARCGNVIKLEGKRFAMVKKDYCL